MIKFWSIFNRVYALIAMLNWWNNFTTLVFFLNDVFMSTNNESEMWLAFFYTCTIDAYVSSYMQKISCGQ